MNQIMHQLSENGYLRPFCPENVNFRSLKAVETAAHSNLKKSRVSDIAEEWIDFENFTAYRFTL